MNNEISVKDIKNVVAFDKKDIFPFASKDGDLYMVIGSDKEATGTAFAKLVYSEKQVINFKSLVIYQSQAILANYGFEEHLNVYSKLDSIATGSRLWMPSTFDFDNRCAYKFNREPLKYTERDVITYLKFCVSMIGNPEYYLLFKISKHHYLNSEFYKTVIKPKYK